MLKAGTVKSRSLLSQWISTSFRVRGSSSTTTDNIFRRSYCRTTPLGEENAATSVKKQNVEEQKINKLAARDFNSRRASYKRQVSALRREYAQEIAEQKAADKAEQEALERELTRRRLERQRRKNIRSAQNAIRQEELRKQREREFNQHLEHMQRLRDAKNGRFAKARQLVIDELEEEAPLWLTTPEEVEAAFTPEAEQLLWARPGGVLGAPNPSIDCHFWQYETHTWHMDKTYKTQREVLLEELEEMAYEEANIDESFWTEERVEEQRRLEEKARLRAMVHSAGRTELLRKQKQMLDEQFTTEEGEVPKPMPAPNLKFLRDDEAMEQEGAKLLMEDPTRFFVFENAPTTDGQGRINEEADDEEEEGSSAEYTGPTLGAPVGLRDPLREGSHQNRVFPQIIGKTPKLDTRSDREKKQQEREERMWAAAQAEAQTGAGGMEAVELAAQEQTVEDLAVADINYDEHDEWDSDEEEWTKGLDPTADEDILNTPRERRYTEDDIDWVLGQLKEKVHHYEKQFSADLESLKQITESEMRLESGKDEPFEEGSLDAALLSLPEKELLALSDLDDRYVEGMLSDEELSDAAKAIPGLTEEQIKLILERDRSS